MQSLVSIANLRSRGFSRFSLLGAVSLNPSSPTSPPHNSAGSPPVRQRAILTAATFLLSSVYYANFLAYEGATATPPSALKKFIPICSVFIPVPSFPLRLAPTAGVCRKTIRTDG